MRGLITSRSDSTNLKEVINVNKVIIVPIVAVLAMVVKLITGIELDQETQAVIAESVGYVVLGVTGVIGVVKSFDKKKEDK